MLIETDYLLATKPLAHSMKLEQLYEAVRVYLRNRIENNGREKISEDNFGDLILSPEEFRIYYNEIMGREKGETAHEYWGLFQEMMYEAGVVEERVFPRKFYS